MMDTVKAKPETEEKIRHCPMYKVIFHNDSVTTFEFVIVVLMRFFNKSETEAAQLAYKIHAENVGCVGVYPLETAEFKRDQTISLARAYKYPLQVTVEPD